MMLPLDQSILDLLNASRDDQENLSSTINHRSFGFHAQQAVEILLKALIGGHDQKYKYTHDLEELTDQAAALGEQLPVDTSLIVKLTDYAGIWRYQEPEAILPVQRAELRQVVIHLRIYATQRLVVLRPGVNWTEFK